MIDSETGTPLIRSSSSLGRGSALLILLLLFAAIAFPVLFLGSTVSSVTAHGVTAEGAYDYHGPRPLESYTRDPLGSMAGDTAIEAYAAGVLRTGTLPLWNPYQGLGYPFLADPSSKIFYAPNLLRLIVPTAYWDFFGLAHLFGIGVFLFLFCREAGLPRKGALAAGACAFGMGHWLLFLPATSVIQTATWAPLLLYCVERTIARPGQGYVTALLAAVGTYALWTGGHPSPAIMITISIAIYVGIRVVQVPESWRRFPLTIAGFVLGFLVAAPMWLNFLSAVANDPDVQNKAYPVHYAFGDLAGFFIPNLFGAINAPLYSDADGWGMGYVPLFITFLAVAGMTARGRMTPHLVALGAISVIWLGWGMNLPVFNALRHLPFLGRLNPNYLWSLPSITLCVAAGSGVLRLLAADSKDRRRILIAWLVFSGMLAALVAYCLAVPFFGRPSLTGIGAARAFQPAVLWFILCCAVAGINWRRSQEEPAGPLMAVIFAGIALSAMSYFPDGNFRHAALVRALSAGTFAAIVALAWLMRSSAMAKARGSWIAVATVPTAAIGAFAALTVPGLPHRTDPFAAPPYIEWLKQATKQGADRVYGISGTLFPNFASNYHISSVNILVSMVPAWHSNFFERMLDPTLRPFQFFGLPGPSDALPAEHVNLYQRNWNEIDARYFVGRGVTLGFVRAPAVFQHSAYLDPTFQTPDIRPGLELSGRDDAPALEATTDCESGPFDGVEAMLSTFGKQISGRLELGVFAGETLIASARANGSDVSDNAVLPFHFEAPLCRERGQRLRLRLSYVSDAPVRPLLAWHRTGQREFAFRRFRDADVEARPGATYTPSVFSRPIKLSTTCAAPGELRTVLRLSTFGQVNPGALVVDYFNQSGRIARTELDTAELQDNAFAATEPARVCTQAGETVNLEISFRPGNERSRIADWREPEFSLPLVLLMAKPAGKDDLRLAYTDRRTGVEVWENTSAKPRAYLAPAWQAVADWQAAQRAFAQSEDRRATAYVEQPLSCPSGEQGGKPASISDLSVEPNSVRMVVDASAPGVLTLTDLWMPGWRATVNGVDQQVFRVNGIFRGVCLAQPGQHAVVFTYEPPLLRHSLALAALGIFGIAGLGFCAVRRRGARP